MSEPSTAEQVIGGIIGGLINTPLGSVTYTVRHLPVDLVLMHASMGGGYWAGPMMFGAGLTTIGLSPVMGIIEGAQYGTKGPAIAFRSPIELLLKKDVDQQYLHQAGKQMETISTHHENVATPATFTEPPLENVSEPASTFVPDKPKKGMIFSQSVSETPQVEKPDDSPKPGSSFKPK